MAAPIVVPFNNNPASISIKTASYTIPAGKYAIVSPKSAFFTLNGVDVFSIDQSFSYTETSASAVIRYFVSDGAFSFITSISGTRTGNTSAGSVTLSAGSTNSFTSSGYTSLNRTLNGTSSASNIQIPTGTLYVSSSNSNSGLYTWTINVTGKILQTKVTDLWVPSGSVLAGNNYIVTEYNQIS